MNHNDELISRLIPSAYGLSGRQKLTLARSVIVKEYEANRVERSDGLLGKDGKNLILCVAKGRLAIDLEDLDGKRINAFVATPEKTLYWLQYLPKSTENYSIAIRFPTHSTVFLVSCVLFEKILVENPDLQKAVLEEVRAAMSSMFDLIYELAFVGLEDRLWRHLNTSCRIQRNRCLLVSHEELAAELGVSREAVSRSLGRLARQDRIEIGHKKITILKTE